MFSRYVLEQYETVIDISDTISFGKFVAILEEFDKMVNFPRYLSIGKIVFERVALKEKRY